MDRGWPEALFGVEIQSFRHHSTLTAHTEDVTRNAKVIASGWRLLPVTPDQLRKDPQGVLRLIATALRSADTPTGSATSG